MDKPQSLTMREYIVRKLAVKMMMNEKTVDAVIVHQFSEANAAMANNDSIEISGFGKFVFNRKKAEKKIEIMYKQRDALERQIHNTSLTDRKREVAKMKYDSILQSIEYLKTKLDNA